MSNVIFRGPLYGNGSNPQTVTKIVKNASLPGVMVVINGDDELEEAAAGGAGRLFVLSNLASYQDIRTAYTAGESGVAYRPTPNLEFYCQTVAATYAKGDELTVGAGGALTKVVSEGDVIVAYADEAKTTSSSDLFLDVVMADRTVQGA